MGLAAYGRRRPALYDFFRSRTSLDGLGVKLSLEDDWPERLERITGPLLAGRHVPTIARSSGRFIGGGSC